MFATSYFEMKRSFESDFAITAVMSLVASLFGAVFIIAEAYGLAGVVSILAGKTGWLPIIGYIYLLATISILWLLRRSLKH
jgi:hypothetical protein